MKLHSKDYLLVGLQGILFVAYVLDITIIDLKIPPKVKGAAFIISGIGALVFMIAMLQLNKNLSPFPTPKSNAQLIQNGLYKYVRHPIYTGILLSFMGYAIYVASLYKLIITILLLFVFIVKSIYEEKKLIGHFNNYVSYKKKTGRFFPKLF
jgi:protein-S-isoprenylcysteine O-methyltransferase Ste14